VISELHFEPLFSKFGQETQMTCATMCVYYAKHIDKIVLKNVMILMNFSAKMTKILEN
jgi:hypothetical protein